MYNLPFTGNLTKKPELVQGAENPRCNFYLAVNEGERGSENEKTNFIPFTAFGHTATNMVESLNKGDKVLVIGRANTYNKDVQLKGEDKSLTMVGFTAVEVGPSLRFATAKVTKVASGKAAADESFSEEDKPAAKKAAPARATASRTAPASKSDDDF